MKTSSEIRQSFTNFMKKRGHTLLPPSSLVPEGDASVLFTTAGMQQFKPYYSQPELAASPRICSIQPSLRTSDIEEVGDNRHLTLFEMLGNFSFGYEGGDLEDPSSPTPYFKKTAIQLAYEFITMELAIDQKRLYVTVYQGNAERGISKDEESADIWRSLGLTDIRYEGEDNFWGPTGSEGPCGPTTEIYADEIEIWNLVFNEFYCDSLGQLTALDYKGVDTGSGLERVATVLQGKKEVFATDLFAPIMAKIKELSDPDKYNEQAARIITDHLKASMFLIADGVRPANKAQGYILRRLIRRAMVKAQSCGLDRARLVEIVDLIQNMYAPDYDRLVAEYGMIVLVLNEELSKFSRTLEVGLKEYAKAKEQQSDKIIPTEVAFKLFDTYGFPIELTAELASTDGYQLDLAAFQERFKSHQETSRAGLDKVFKGGLADQEPQTIKHHTAHHLLLAALRQVLGDEVHQRGSNVTEERLRIDFSYPEKVTGEQIAKVENIVNQSVIDDLEVRREEMTKTEAEKLGALAEFGTKYGETVTVYTIFNQDGSVLSREFCGGPHVEKTGQLGQFKILKEEASSAGVRRIKATTR